MCLEVLEKADEKLEGRVFVKLLFILLADKNMCT